MAAIDEAVTPTDAVPLAFRLFFRDRETVLSSGDHGKSGIPVRMLLSSGIYQFEGQT